MTTTSQIEEIVGNIPCKSLDHSSHYNATIEAIQDYRTAQIIEAEDKALKWAQETYIADRKMFNYNLNQRRKELYKLKATLKGKIQ